MIFVQLLRTGVKILPSDCRLYADYDSANNPGAPEITRKKLYLHRIYLKGSL